MTMRRRQFLQVAGAAAAVGSGAGAGDAHAARPAGQGQPGGTQSPPPAGSSAPNPQAGTSAQGPRRDTARFFQSEDMNFVFLMMLGGAYYGAADVGAALAIADQFSR